MRVNSPTHAHTATHGGVEGHAHARSAAQASGSFNGHPVSMARPDGASGSRSLGTAAKVVERLAQRLMRGTRPAQREPQRTEVAPLHIPQDYGWPLGLMAGKNPEAMHPDDETLTERLRAWFDGADRAHEDADAKNMHDSPLAGSRRSEHEASPGTHSHESHGLMDRNNLEAMHPDDAYEAAFATHESRVSAQVEQSALHRFGHTHVDDDTLREQLHAWLNGEDGAHDDADVKFMHDSPEGSGRFSESDVSHSASPGTYSHESMSPRFDESPATVAGTHSRTHSEAASVHSNASHESEIQEVHDEGAAQTAPTHDASTSGTRRVRFALEVNVRTFEEATHVDGQASPAGARESHVDEKAPLHGRDRTSVKPKGHKPDSPEYIALARQRSINQAAWQTVVSMKSPRISADQRKMTAEMFKKNQIRFDFKRSYGVKSEDEPQVMAVATALQQAAAPAPSRSFMGKVKNLMRSVVPARTGAPDAGTIRIPGPDLRPDLDVLNGVRA